MRAPVDVARRCLCLELLAQRSVLETDDAPDADAVRATWASRVGDLGITLTAEEAAFLERPTGKLTEDERDDLDGRSTGAAILLWALGRTDTKPTFANADELVAERGLLGDGSIAKAKTAAERATLRSEAELDTALAAFVKTRGKAKDPDAPEQIYAGVAAHHLTWILTDTMSFDEDITI
ncbi:MAG: DUF4272 domain-containing protein [Labilithrix sp.]